jgi:hypothetical protein
MKIRSLVFEIYASIMKLQLFAAKVLKTEFYYSCSRKGIHLSDRNIKRKIRVVC